MFMVKPLMYISIPWNFAFLKTSIQYGRDAGGVSGSNWAPMMQRRASLSDGCTSIVIEFQIKLHPYQYDFFFNKFLWKNSVSVVEEITHEITWEITEEKSIPVNAPLEIRVNAPLWCIYTEHLVHEISDLMQGFTIS